MSQSVISLSLQNTTPLAQPVSVFNPLPQQESSGSGNAAQSSYSYYVANEIADAIASNFTYVSVIYSVNGGVYNIATVNYGGVINTIQKLVNALNSLNQATFFISGVNQISCYSIASNGNNYYYSSISTNNNYTTNSFTGSTSYNNLGSVIYNTGYTLNSIGTVSRITTSNSWWINSIPNTINGAFNRSGVFSSNAPTYGTTGLGIFSNVYCSEAKQVYIGMSLGDGGIGNSTTLWINNNPIISITDEIAVCSSLNSQLGTSTTSAFKDFWSIYPVTLQKGNNYILLNNAGYGGYASSPFAFEVYDNTSTQIAAATSYASLNLLYSSKNYTGNMI